MIIRGFGIDYTHVTINQIQIYDRPHMLLDTHLDLILRFLFNITGMFVLLFLIYYPRYRHKETAISAALFNIFVFAVLSVLSSVEFSLAAGFGLFAILALFTLRSEQITKSDMAYFFGSISIAVIAAIEGTAITFITVMTALVLLAVYLIDHPRILKSVTNVKVTLDNIPRDVISDPEALRSELTQRLGVDILSYRIISVSYVDEVVQAEIDYRPVS